VEFYKSAFGAVETYRLDDPDAGVVARLAVQGAEFWVSGDQEAKGENTEGKPVRMVLVVPDPDSLFNQAIAAGATEVFPVGEGHGWRLGRILDPFGFHWEIGYELSAS